MTSTASFPLVSGDFISDALASMKAAADSAMSRVQAALTTDATALGRIVSQYRSTLADIGPRVVAVHKRVAEARAKDPANPVLLALQARTTGMLGQWMAHTRGYAAEERPATEAEKGKAIQVGFVPVLIAVVAGGAVVSLSLAGVAWAVVHYEEAQTLQQQVAAVERDPSLAAPLATLNQTAPSSGAPTLPTPGNDKGGGGWGWIAAALGLGAAAVYLLPKLGKG
jgi:hypothetical protein